MDTTEPTDSSLFLQLLVFTDCAEIKPLLLPLKNSLIDCVLYKNFNDPQGIALLAVTDDPEQIVTDLPDVVCSRLFRTLTQRPDLTMTGRAWDGTQRSDQLETVVKNEEMPWGLWYTMRGTPAFARLHEVEQAAVLDSITSPAGLNAEDFVQIRLKSHALDGGGNEFMHGVHARSPRHLSLFVEAIKRTEQYAQHIVSAGPFFVGRTHQGTAAAGGPGARW